MWDFSCNRPTRFWNGRAEHAVLSDLMMLPNPCRSDPARLGAASCLSKVDKWTFSV